MIRYNGNKANSQSPSAEPLPGNAPTVNLPQDLIDDVSAATVTQALKTCADFIDWDQAILNGQPAFASNAGSGYTAVTHVGSGPSTGCVPSPVSATIAQPTYLPYSYLVTITTAGAVATAKFSISYDGGATTPVTGVTTAATYVDGYGTTLAFTGTLVLNDTYSFRPTDVPQILTKVTDGYGKSSFDHLGLPLGNYNLDFRENWVGTTGGLVSSTSLALVPTFNQWQYKVDSVSSYVNSGTFDIDAFPFPYLELQALGTGGFAGVSSATQLFYTASSANTTIVFETMVLLSVGIGHPYTLYIGLDAKSANETPGTGTDATAMFVATTSGWSFITQNDGGSYNTVTTSVPAVSGNVYNLRMEITGAQTSTGEMARIFINQKLVGTTTTGIPLSSGNKLYLFFYLTSGDSNSHAAFFGPVRLVVNRANSVGV